MDVSSDNFKKYILNGFSFKDKNQFQNIDVINCHSVARI